MSLLDVLKIKLTAPYHPLRRTGEELSMSPEGNRLFDLSALLHVLFLEVHKEN